MINIISSVTSFVSNYLVFLIDSKSIFVYDIEMLFHNQVGLCIWTLSKMFNDDFYNNDLAIYVRYSTKQLILMIDPKRNFYYKVDNHKGPSSSHNIFVLHNILTIPNIIHVDPTV